MFVIYHINLTSKHQSSLITMPLIVNIGRSQNSQGKGANSPAQQGLFGSGFSIDRLASIQHEQMYPKFSHPVTTDIARRKAIAENGSEEIHQWTARISNNAAVRHAVTLPNTSQIPEQLQEQQSGPYPVQSLSSGPRFNPL